MFWRHNQNCIRFSSRPAYEKQVQTTTPNIAKWMNMSNTIQIQWRPKSTCDNIWNHRPHSCNLFDLSIDLEAVESSSFNPTLHKPVFARFRYTIQMYQRLSQVIRLLNTFWINELKSINVLPYYTRWRLQSTDISLGTDVMLIGWC